MLLLCFSLSMLAVCFLVLLFLLLLLLHLILILSSLSFLLDLLPPSALFLSQLCRSQITVSVAQGRVRSPSPQPRYKSYAYTQAAYVTSPEQKRRRFTEQVRVSTALTVHTNCPSPVPPAPLSLSPAPPLSMCLHMCFGCLHVLSFLCLFWSLSRNPHCTSSLLHPSIFNTRFSWAQVHEGQLESMPAVIGQRLSLLPASPMINFKDGAVKPFFTSSFFSVFPLKRTDLPLKLWTWIIFELNHHLDKIIVSKTSIL